LLTRDDPALVGMAQEIADSWAVLGFTVRVESAAPDMLLARLESGDFDAALIELSFEPGADPDSFVFWHQGEYERGQNYGAMDDRRVSEALEMGRREAAGINRVIHYRAFQEIFAERAPALILYYPLYTYAADERLEGVQFGFLSSPADRFRHIEDWAFRAP
jgi:ABC-type transport system substrate-binding protein